ncbi:MAG: molybdopterin-dependent oxidoreductase, partial [Firmicutes bacterium]|nr:molybdopterin-dependent oxidoreductase [Bacillota bacterium]
KGYLCMSIDVGFQINPSGVRGQISGGIAQGAGWALYENLVFQEGMPQNTSLSNYILMGIKDMPDITAIAVETNDPVGPYGAKGVGEPTLIPIPPAIANAVEDAIGVRIRELPISPEKVFWALNPQLREVGK